MTKTVLGLNKEIPYSNDLGDFHEYWLIFEQAGPHNVVQFFFINVIHGTFHPTFTYTYLYVNNFKTKNLNHVGRFLIYMCFYKYKESFPFSLLVFHIN